MLTRATTRPGRNDNGQIDREEFRDAVRGLRRYVPDAVCDALFDEFDTDGSGEISYDEVRFCTPLCLVYRFPLVSPRLSDRRIRLCSPSI